MARDIAIKEIIVDIFISFLMVFFLVEEWVNKK